MPVTAFYYACLLCNAEHPTEKEARACFDRCVSYSCKCYEVVRYACIKCGMEFPNHGYCKRHELDCVGNVKHGSCATCHHLDAEGKRYEPCPEKITGEVCEECSAWELGR